MKKTIVFILLTLLLQGCASNKHVTCSVKASSLNLMNSSFSKNKHSYDIVKKRYDGMLYKTPIVVNYVTKDKAENNTPIKALFSTLSANKACDVDWIINTFPDDEKEQIKALALNVEMMKKYKEYQDSITKAEVFGEIHLKDEVIFLVEFTHTNRPVRRVVPVYVKTKDGWKQTNSLVENEDYDLIFSAYNVGTVTPG